MPNFHKPWMLPH